MDTAARITWFFDTLVGFVCLAGVCVNLLMAVHGPDGPVFYTSMAALCALGAWCSLALARDAKTGRA